MRDRRPAWSGWALEAWVQGMTEEVVWPMSAVSAQTGVRSPIPEHVGGCVLWFAAVPWDELQRSDRHLVEAIDQPVVWVDRPRSPLRRGGRWLPAKWGGVEVVRSVPLLIRVTPLTLPFSSRWGIRAVSAPLKRGQVRGALKALGARPHTVVVSNLFDLSGRWGGNAVEVLRGSDDYVAGAGLMGLSARWLVHLEEAAVQKADVVLTVSEVLAAKWRGLGATPHVLPNGCTPVPEAYFTPSGRERSTGVRSASPVVGLVGYLSRRIDIRLLEEISRSGIRLLLIGPRDPRWEPERFAELIRRESVDYVGQIPAERIPSYLRRVDVGITPYVDSDFNRASFPLKTLEYLGAGIPVVSSNLPAARWLRNDMISQLGEEAAGRHLAIEVTVSDFVAAVRRLSESRSVALDRERWRFASMHSWSTRATALQAIVEDARAGNVRAPENP